MHNAKYTLHCDTMKSRKLLIVCILIAGIFLAIVGFAAAYSISLPYIRIDPVENPNTAELLVLSGTTNLPAGTELLVKVKEEPGSSGEGLEPTNSGSMARVISQAEGSNRWSAGIDTLTLRPDAYRVEVTQMTYDHEAFRIILGETSAVASFTLAGEFLGPDPSQMESVPEDPFFQLDTVGVKHAGDQFLVTGTTNLPVGSEVIWEVAPSVAPNFPDTGTFSGMMANSEVTRGDGGTNRVSLAVDSTALEPGEYTVRVSNVVGDVYSPGSEPGNITTSTGLIVQ